MTNVIRLEQTQNRTPTHGWLLYADSDPAPNPHYINLYRNACQKRGMSITFGTYAPHVIHQTHEKAALWQTALRQIHSLLGQEAPLYVINRTRDYRLAELLESSGVRVFNNSRIARLGNDKAQACRYMQKRGIPVIPTAYGTETPPQWYPAVVKSCDGHGGTEVSLIRDKKAWMAWKACHSQNVPDPGKSTALPCQKRSGNHQEKNYIIQQAASDLGKDVRVYIVGNQIISAVLRTSKTDFRSNYCLGGHVEMYHLSDRERELVERVVAGLTAGAAGCSESLSIGMAGIDFIFHHGEMVFNEIEDVVGARGLYSLTGYDIVDAYIGYIWKELQHDTGNTDRSERNTGNMEEPKPEHGAGGTGGTDKPKSAHGTGNTYE